MNILIAYAGKTGTTQRCAKMLEQGLKNVTVINLVEETPDISKYDLIIIGGSIRIGILHSKAKKFIKDNKEKLLNKKTAYYICCGFSDGYKKYFETNIDKELLDKSIIYDTFGGEMDVNKQKGIEKFIVKMVNKTEQGKKEVKILSETIERFINTINKI